MVTTLMSERRSQKRPFFYGWVIVAVMTVIGSLSMALGTLNLGLFIRPMGDELGIGRGVFGMAYSARMVVGAGTSPIVGRIIDRIGSRLLVPLSAFIAGSALIGVANISHGWQLVVLFAAMGIVAMGGPANLTTTVPIAKWFVRKRGRAMAIVTAGPFIGGVIFVPLTQLFIDSLGWRVAWMILAGIGAGLIVVLAPILIRRQPEDMGLVPDGDVSSISKDMRSFSSTSLLQPIPSQTEVSWTLQEALHSPTFWRLTCVFSFVLLATGTGGLHRIPNFMDKGLDPSLVAIAASMDAVAGGLSTIVLGLLTEKISSRFLGSLAFIFLAGATVLNIMGSTAPVMFLSFVLFGTGIGGLMLLNSFLWADYFGREHLGSIRGFVMPIMLVSSGAGAPLAGYLRDVTGTYDNIWWVSVVILLVTAVILALTRRPVRATIEDL